MGNKGSAEHTIHEAPAASGVIVALKWKSEWTALKFKEVYQERNKERKEKKKQLFDKIIAKKNSSPKNMEANFDPLNILTAFLVFQESRWFSTCVGIRRC